MPEPAGALSQFIEDAVKWPLFNKTVGEARQALADVPADERDEMLGEAVKSVRDEKNRERRRGLTRK